MIIELLILFPESHNLELDLDLAGDLALLKKNLAKMRKGRMGKGLNDVLIEEFDWVNLNVLHMNSSHDFISI